MAMWGGAQNFREKRTSFISFDRCEVFLSTKESVFLWGHTMISDDELERQ